MSAEQRAPAEVEASFSLLEARIILRKYGKVIAIVAGAFFVLGLLYSMAATRQYTAASRLLIDTPRNPISALEPGGGSGGGGGGLAIPEVESQLQVLSSERIALKVLERFESAVDSGVEGPPPGLLTRVARGAKSAVNGVLGMFSDRPLEADPQRVKLMKLMSGLGVRRLGSSYVVELVYTSPDPKFSADVANAFAEVYVQDEIDTKAEIWKRASVWLQDRVNELRARSEEAQRAAQDFKARNGNNAETWPRARELDRTAEAYDALYSAFLKRYTDSVQQQTFPVSQARIIGVASRPTAPSAPQTGVILSLATIMGAGLGTTLAFIRWRLDRTIRTPAQIARYGIRCLTALPRLPKAISRDPAQTARTVVRAPRSQFAENLRVVRAELSIAQRQRSMRFIGLTSALSGEGKTTISSNLAHLLAATESTLLIDADVRNPKLTQALGPFLQTDHRAHSSERRGHIQPVAVSGAPGLHFLSLQSGADVNITNWFEHGAFDTLLETYKSQYDRIVVDLPPTAIVAEARYAAPLLDAIIVVVEWEVTAADAFMSCIDTCDVDPGKVFGVILNKTHPSVLNYGQTSAYIDQYFEGEAAMPVEVSKGRIRV